MALTDSLISFWPLDEASGNALDAQGAHDLTETAGVVGTTTGKLSGARGLFTTDTAYFRKDDHADLSWGDNDRTWMGWIQISTKASASILVKSAGTNSTMEGDLHYDSASDRFRFRIGSGGTAITVTASSFGAPSTGVWYMIACGHDSVNNEIWISVNDGTVDTTAHTGGVNDSTGRFAIGRLDVGGNYFNGYADEVGWWHKRVPASEITQFYNSGNGLAYPFGGGGGATILPQIMQHHGLYVSSF